MYKRQGSDDGGGRGGRGRENDQRTQAAIALGQQEQHEEEHFKPQPGTSSSTGWHRVTNKECITALSAIVKHEDAIAGGRFDTWHFRELFESVHEEAVATNNEICVALQSDVEALPHSVLRYAAYMYKRLQSEGLPQPHGPSLRRTTFAKRL